MKIGIFSDTHLGYLRFEEDSYSQALLALTECEKQSDILICAGDIFDTKTPKLETLKKAFEIFSKTQKKIVMIFGNHERRTKDSINPVQLLSSLPNLVLLHGKDYVFEKDNQKIQFFGLSSVPEEYAQTALKKTLESFIPIPDAFKILIIHQSIAELMVQSEFSNELSLEYLSTLPFDLIINGHIHEKTISLNGKFLIPGSTVVTQLKKEQSEKRGYFIYNTLEKTATYNHIHSRPFHFIELNFKDATLTDVESQINSSLSSISKDEKDPIICIKLKGTLLEGNSPNNLNLPKSNFLFIDNSLDNESLLSKIEKIQQLRSDSTSLKTLAISQLIKRTDGKITLFEPIEFFEKLSTENQTVETLLSSINKNPNPPK